jgi:hypothetical protein
MRGRARHTTKADETPEFIEFWDAWRPNMNRNDGRGAARDEFIRHVEDYGADPQDIADGAKWFIHNGGNSGEFRVHAQTWLNRRAYEDGAELWRRHVERMESRSTNVVHMEPARPRSAFLSRWDAGEFKKAE